MGISMYNFIENSLMGEKVHYPRGSNDVYTIVRINSAVDSANIINDTTNKWVYLAHLELIGDGKNYEIEE